MVVQQVALAQAGFEVKGRFLQLDFLEVLLFLGEGSFYILFFFGVVLGFSRVVCCFFGGVACLGEVFFSIFFSRVFLGLWRFWGQRPK